MNCDQSFTKLNKMDWKIRFSKLTLKIGINSMYCKNERPNSVFGKKKKSCVLFRGPDQVGLFFRSSLKENYKYALDIAWKHCKFIHRRKKTHEKSCDDKKSVIYKSLVFICNDWQFRMYIFLIKKNIHCCSVGHDFVCVKSVYSK